MWGGMATLMLVADEGRVSDEVRAALALGAWEIEEVSDPREAPGLAADRLPEAVAVDMQVGSMGGMAVVRAIRQELEAPQHPRIVLLLDRPADMFLAKRAGADACALKPLLASSLRRALADDGEEE